MRLIPDGIMNPGKIIDPPPMTENLRFGPKYNTIKIDTYFDFSAQDGFERSIEMCNGVGACRKTLTGTMCPSFIATREEEHSTRGTCKCPPSNYLWCYSAQRFHQRTTL